MLLLVPALCSAPNPPQTRGKKCKKKRKIEIGLRTPEDQAAGPIHIPSELLGIAPCQAETIFTYLYIEVLTFVANASIMLSGAHGGLFSHAGAFCPVHQCPNSSEATSWETAWETHPCCPRCGSPPPSPTLAAKSAYGADWHAIGRTVRDSQGGVLSAWPRSELQLQHAHRRSQLPRLG